MDSDSKEKLIQDIELYYGDELLNWCNDEKNIDSYELQIKLTPPIDIVIVAQKVIKEFNCKLWAEAKKHDLTNEMVNLRKIITRCLNYRDDFEISNLKMKLEKYENKIIWSLIPKDVRRNYIVKYLEKAVGLNKKYQNNLIETLSERYGLF